MNALEKNMSKNLSPLISWLVIIIFFHIFLGLIRNSYGNYVVQRALNVASGEDKEKLLKAISMRLPEVSDRKIRNKWEHITKLNPSINNFVRLGNPSNLRVETNKSAWGRLLELQITSHKLLEIFRLIFDNNEY